MQARGLRFEVGDHDRPRGLLRPGAVDEEEANGQAGAEYPSGQAQSPALSARALPRARGGGRFQTFASRTGFRCQGCSRSLS